MIWPYVPFFTFSGCSDLCDSVGRTIWIAAERAGAAMAQWDEMGSREGGQAKQRKRPATPKQEVGEAKGTRPHAMEWRWGWLWTRGEVDDRERER